MCGVWGLINRSGGTPLPESRAALQALTHRGPDDEGCEEIRVGDWHGLFAHRRLSILDLSQAGHQPMSRGRWTVTYNGEIYNAAVLRTELEQAGCAFESTCDTEVLCWALEKWGFDCLSRCNGMFAFGATDGDRLVLVRDRLGIKPLYFWQTETCFAFSSELKALAALPGFKRVVDRSTLEHYLTFGYIPAPLCIYKNCGKLRPSEVLVWQDGVIDRWLFWQPDLTETGKAALSEAEAADQLEALLSESIEMRRMADVPLGAFLSGGIDSSLICALAQKQMCDPLKTFTIGFDFAEYDESKHAGEIAAHLGTDHTCVVMTERELLETVPRIPSLYDEPFADPSALPTYLLSKVTREQVTVALSGDGGDELFYGYTRYLGYERMRKYESLPVGLRHAFGKALYGLFGNSFMGKRGKALLYREFDEAAMIFAGIFHLAYFDRLIGKRFAMEETRFHEVYSWLRSSALDLERIGPLLDQHFYLPDDILCKVDRASMAHSLEVRVPFLDHRVAEFANRLPHRFKWQSREQKHLLKVLLSRHVPRRLWSRPKCGFGAPLNHWFCNELRPMIETYLEPARLQTQGLLRPDYVSELTAEHLAGKRDNQYAIWSLLVLQLWLEQADCEVPRAP